LASWPRIAGLRVVMSWPDSPMVPPPPQPPPGRGRRRLAGLAGAVLLAGGAATIGFAALLQEQAPAPARSAAGTIGNAGGKGLSLRRSMPVSVTIPAIGVRSSLLRLGLNSDGSLQVPSLTTSAGLAAWYRGSVTPGQIGTSLIEGHVDSYAGPAVFFRLGALRPGNSIDVRLADGVTAVFLVTGVREYSKDKFPANIIYGPEDYAALRLVTCGGAFDAQTGHYLGAVVVFASLESSAKKE
jgi:hypothetical protein